jgi:hypothetical protein
MFMWLYVFLGSGVALVVYALFLKAENIQGRRLILSGPRTIFDTVLLKIFVALANFSNFLSGKVVRLTIHFIVHQMLVVVLSVLKFLESHISRLQWRNRISARRIRLTETKNHLDLIAEHQEENALTDKQKQKLKDKSIGS